MASFCKYCGNELKENALFCTACGEQVKSIQPQNPEPINKIPQRHGTVQKNRIPLIVFSIVGVIIIGFAAFFIIHVYKSPKSDAVQTVSTSSQNASKSNSKTNKPTSSKNNQETIISEFTGKLNALQIHNADQVLSVGNWKVEDKNGTLFIDANNIPLKDLAGIFDLYDQGKLAPLQTWAKDVYYIAEDLSLKLNKEWIIDVSDHCVKEYPKTLSSTDLNHYSGSCGYSVPVLTGDKKDDLSLIINSSVFGTLNNNMTTSVASGDYILPGSDFNRLSESDIDALTLDQLRLARNEIYARHGYLFKSADLQAYFSKKAWYHPDASYDGTTLSETEKDNVELIQNRERSLQ